MGPDDKDIKFPTAHYVGFQTRPSADDLPLGFMTPDGTDSAAKKRKTTVDEWSKGWGYDGKNEGALPPQTYENKPMSGFKLGRSIRHGGGGWGQGNVKWRIEDPRGFELEITSPNLAHILASTTIENGEILEQCMWARLKSENILVPVTTDVYKAAQANTERANKKVALKDVQLGDHVVMQNGQEGIYLGAYFAVNGSGSDYGYGFDGIKVDEKRKYFFRLLKGSKSYGGDKDERYLIVATPKIAEVTPTDSPLSAVEAEATIMKALKAGKNFETGTTAYGGAPYAITDKGGAAGLAELKVELEDINTGQARSTLGDKSCFFMLGSNWVQVTANNFNSGFGGSRGGPSFWAHVFDRQAYEQRGEFIALEETRNRYYSSYKSYQSIHVQTQPPVTVQVVRVTGRTALGNEIDFYG